MFYFLFTIILIYTIFTLWFAVSAYREMEPRAGRRSLMATAGLAAFLAFKLDIEKVFERFPNLAKRKHLSADVLSGGEQQMLARPKILMMDEPSLACPQF